jgi:uncharacterized protein (DUF58 family)
VAVLRLELPMAAAGTPRQVRCALGGAAQFGIEVTLLLPHGPLVVGTAAHVHGDTLLVATLPGQPRGLLPVPAVRLTSRHPFGLLRFVRDVMLPTELVTYPSPHGAAPERSQALDRSGDQLAPQGRRGNAVAGLRAFRSGDSMADVHWKATARRGTVVVKEREPEGDHTHDIVLDRRCPPAELDQRLAAATAVVLAARSRGQQLRLWSQDTTLTIGPDSRGEVPALRWLAAATTLPTTAPGPRRPGRRPAANQGQPTTAGPR